jgi:protein NrfD
MKEELFVSGRNIPNIDPHVHVWHWPIPLYLFLGGLAAGIMFFAALYTILGKEKELPSAVRKAMFIPPFALVIGLLALLYDLTHVFYSWQLFTTIRLESPMSWGAWTLLVITPLSFVWAANNITDLFPSWDWKLGWLKKLFAWWEKNIIWFSWVIIVLSVILGIYTGILLSAFNARPLWNNAILGPLFLTSGLSTGAAAIMLVSKDHKERAFFSRIDILLICIELFFIIHLFMGFLSGPQVQLESAQLFFGGAYTVPFWVFVVFLGLVFPGILEFLELRGYKISTTIPAILIILGGLIFRFIIVDAGQITRYLY